MDVATYFVITLLKLRSLKEQPKKTIIRASKRSALNRSTPNFRYETKKEA